MASVADICNIGLSHIGAEAFVTSIDPPDGTAEAGYCETFYPIARRELLEAAPWSFAMRRVALAPIANPSTAWAYAYAVPSDMLSAARVLSAADIAAGYGEGGSAPFEIEGDTLLTNEPDAVLKYKRDITDAAKFPPLFVSSLGMLLASYLAGPVIKGSDGASIGRGWRQMAEQQAARAAAEDANSSSEGTGFLPASIKARE